MKLNKIFEVQSVLDERKTPCDIPEILEQEYWSKSKKEYVKLNLNVVFVPLAFIFLFNFTNVIKVNESIDWKDGMTKNTILAIKKDSCEYEVPFQDLDHVGHYYRLINENNHLRLCNEYINNN